jgi:hypothetical protein
MFYGSGNINWWYDSSSNFITTVEQFQAASSSALKNDGLLQKAKKEKPKKEKAAVGAKTYIKIGYLPFSFEPDKEGGTRVAIIIPYRNRRKHLMRFLDHISHLDPHTVLYDIYVIEQDNNEKFNRGLLLDIGYLAAHSKNIYDRYIFHDVDSYPDQTLFSQYGLFMDKNIHYASPKLGYKYKYDRFVGGVIGTSAADFEKINGFSTIFSGWGGEDDSFYTRMALNSVPLYRPSSGRYELPGHARSEYNKDKRKNLVVDADHWRTNGLGQLSNATYQFVEEPEFFGNGTGRRRVSDSEPKRVSPRIRCFFAKATFSAINFTAS